jgi:hypothetical protein
MKRPDDPKEALRAFIDFWVSEHALAPGRKRAALYASFHDDIDVLHGYLNAYATADVSGLTWLHMSERNHYIPESTTRQIGRVYDALMLPLMLRLDPREPEAAIWARLFLPFGKAGERSEYVLKSRPVIAARRFHRGGVPPEFAALFYRPTMTMKSIDEVIALHRTGIAYEYAQTLLAEGMLVLDA